jgi:hypothetical protein
MNAILDWVNTPIWRWRRYEFRRIDALLVSAGIICVGYYGYTTGVVGAMRGGLLFIMFAMIALWLL